MAEYLQMVRALATGRTEQDLNEKLGELIEAVNETNKSGSITLTISVAPDGAKSGYPIVTFEDTITTKLPKEPRGKTRFFVNDGVLSRRHPDQTTLDLPIESEVND